MKTRHAWMLAAAALLTSATTHSAAQGPAPAPPPGPPPGFAQPDKLIDQVQRADILERLIASLHGHYVFADKAKAMAADLRARDVRGEYAQITSAQAFAKKLTQDLRSVTKDLHLSVQYSAQPFPPQAMLDSEEPSAQDLVMERMPPLEAQ